MARRRKTRRNEEIEDMKDEINKKIDFEDFRSFIIISIFALILIGFGTGVIISAIHLYGKECQAKNILVDECSNPHIKEVALWREVAGTLLILASVGLTIFIWRGLKPNYYCEHGSDY